MQDLQIFSNKRFGEVRVTKMYDDYWFVAKDICEILDIKNVSDATVSLEGDEKGVASIDTPGGKQEMLVVNEFGLYALIFKSRKKEAKEFKRWITHKVLPEIRKTGQYVHKPQSIEDLIILQAKSVKELKHKVEHQQDQINTMKNALVHTDEDWRNWVNDQFGRIGFINGNYRELRKQSYDILENRARCRLNVRLDNLKDRLAQNGASKTKISQTNYLDVIEDDQRLKEIYTSVVEKIAIKYSA